MNRTRTISLCFLLMAATTSFAQQERLPIVQLPLSGDLHFSLQCGFGDVGDFSMSTANWNKYTPDFQIPADSLNYSSGEMMNLYTHTYTLATVEYSYKWKFMNAKKIVSSYGIVLGSGVGYSANQNWYKMESFPLDTLTSSQTGNQIYIDSTTSHYKGRSFNSSELIVGITQRFQTNPNRRVSLHFGINAMLGFSVNEQITTYSYESTSVYPYFDGYYTDEQSDYQQQTVASAPSVRSLLVQVPLELSIRPWLRKEALSSLSVGVSVRPSLKYVSVLGEKNTSYGNWYGLLLRYSI